VGRADVEVSEAAFECQAGRKVAADGENLQVGKVIVARRQHRAYKMSSVWGSEMEIIFFHDFSGYDTKDSYQI
jgi:hypothetical protein